MKAWHFVGKTLRDGRRIPDDGVALTYTGPMVMCNSGLHASLHPFDALQYAPGNTICLVECDGDIVRGDDKLICRNRTIIARMDAEPLLRYFARQQALSVVHLLNPPDVVLNYLMGDDAARAAAWDAALDAAQAAARGAAWDAALDAARDDFDALVKDAFEDYL